MHHPVMILIMDHLSGMHHPVMILIFIVSHIYLCYHCTLIIIVTLYPRILLANFTGYEYPGNSYQ